MFKLLKIVKEEDPRRPISTRRWRRRIPGAAGGRSVIDHAASTQSVIISVNKTKVICANSKFELIPWERLRELRV